MTNILCRIQAKVHQIKAIYCEFQACDTGENHYNTCITETSDIADPVRDGGDANLVFGFAEYADGEAERTFKTYKTCRYTEGMRFIGNL
jgi:hypothetical protein